MRNGSIACVLTLVFGSMGFGQGTGKQAAAPYLGTWAGTWASSSEEGGTGEIEVTIEEGNDGAPAGRLKVSGGEAGHSAAFKTLTFDGNKMTAKYDYPLGDGGEILLQAHLEDPKAKGTWKLTPPPGQTADAARGTWTATKR